MLMAESAKESSKSASLVLRIISGDKAAEQELVNTYYRGLYFILNRQTQNHSLSEDLAQDTFIIVIQKARDNGINNPAALSAFIRQTGINLLIAFKRKENRRDTHSVDDIDIHAPNENMEISRALHSNKLLQVTNQLLDELKTTRDKELLRSYFVYDKNKQQICQDLDLTSEHFDRVLFRARQRLKQLILHKIGAQKTDTSVSVSTLLSIGLIAGIFAQSTSENQVEKLITKQVREYISNQHLPYETPKTQSRYLLSKNRMSKQLTSKSRCV